MSVFSLCAYVDKEERHELSSDSAHSGTFDKLLALCQHWITEKTV